MARTGQFGQRRSSQFGVYRPRRVWWGEDAVERNWQPASTNILPFEQPGISTITDDFSSSDTTKWSGYNGSDVTTVGGQAQLTPTTSYHQNTVVQRARLMNSSVIYKVPQMMNVGTTNTMVFWAHMASDVTNAQSFASLEFSVTTVAGVRRLQASRYSVANVETILTDQAYDISKHLWFKIQADITSITWWVSTDGVTWGDGTTPGTPYATMLTSLYSDQLTSMTWVFGTGYTGTEASPGTVLIDNLNLPPVPNNNVSGLSAALSFTGSQPRSTSRAVSAALSFTGAQTHKIAYVLAAALSFVGTLLGNKIGGNTAYTQALSAVLSFTGTQTRASLRSLSAGLGLGASNLVNGTDSDFSSGIGDWTAFNNSPTMSSDSTHVDGGALAGLMTTTTTTAFSSVGLLVTGLVPGQVHTALLRSWSATGTASVSLAVAGVNSGTTNATKNVFTDNVNTFTATSSSHTFVFQTLGTSLVGDKFWIDNFSLHLGTAAAPVPLLKRLIRAFSAQLRHNVGGFAPAALALTPFAYWKLNESSGTSVTDYSANGFTGSTVNSPTLSQSAIGPGLTASMKFTDTGSNATNPYVSITGISAAPLNSGYAVCQWLEIDVVPSGAMYSIISPFTGFYEAFECGITATNHYWYGAIYTVTGGGYLQAASTTVATVGNHFFVLCFDSGSATITVYVDGSQVAQLSTGSATFSFGTVPVALSGDGTGAGVWQGRISDTVIYPRALTGAEVTSLYNAGASVPATLSKQSRKPVTAALSFVGSQARNVRRALAAALSFVGTVAGVKNGGFTAYTQSLTAGLSFAGSQARKTTRSLAGALSFTGAQGKRTSRSLSASQSFSGSSSRVAAHTLVAALSFTGSQVKSVQRSVLAGLSFVGTTTTARALARVLTANLSFIGSQTRQSTRSLTAGLSFIGSVVAGKFLARALTAALSFTGTYVRSPRKAVAASLTFSGLQTRLSSRSLTAGVSFVGLSAKSTSRLLSASLSFAGSTATGKFFARVLTAALSFTGSLAQSKFFARALTAALSFAGSQSRYVPRSLTGVLSFTGTLPKRLTRSLAGVSSFSGGFVKMPVKATAGSVGFSGSQVKGAGRPFSASLSSSGQLSRFVGRSLAAALSFTGALAAGKALARALTAALSFTGSQTRQVRRSLTATLSFTGSFVKTAVKSLTAGLSFVGSQTRVGGKSLSAGLSFTGSSARRVTRMLSAVLSFVGAQARQLNGGGIQYVQGISAQLSFIGSSPRLVRRPLTAGVSFTGSFVRARLKFLSGALSFQPATTGVVTVRGWNYDSTENAAAGVSISSSSGWMTPGTTTVSGAATPIAGDVVLVFEYNDGPTVEFPSGTGWTLKGGFSGTTGEVDIWLRNWTSGDGTYTWIDGSIPSRISVIAVALSGVNLVSYSDGTEAWSQSGTTTQTAPSVSGLTRTDGYLLTFFTSDHNSGTNTITTPPSGATAIAVPATNPAGLARGIYGLALSSSAATTAQTVVTSLTPLNSEYGAGVSIVVKAAAGAPANALVKQISKPFSASATFVGALARRTVYVLAAVLSFVGSQPRRVSRALSAALSFTGLQAKSYGRSLTAGLSFAGSQAKTTFHMTTAALSFTGTQQKRASRSLSAGLSFAGIHNRAVSRLLSAVLSFVGAVTGVKNGGFTAYTQTLTAVLSFSGSAVRSTKHSVAGAVSFAGSQSRSAGKVITAALTFVGAQTRQYRRALSATLSFSGAQVANQTLKRAFTAALSFTGSQARQARRALTAVLAFSGTVATGKFFARALTATLSFVGTQSRRVVRPFTATVSPVGTLNRSFPVLVSAALSFTGSLPKSLRRKLAAGLSFTGSVLSLYIVPTLIKFIAYTGQLVYPTPIVGAAGATGTFVVERTTRYSSALFSATASLAAAQVTKRKGSAIFSSIGVFVPTKTSEARYSATGSFTAAPTTSKPSRAVFSVSGSGSVPAASLSVKGTAAFQSSGYFRTAVTKVMYAAQGLSIALQRKDARALATFTAATSASPIVTTAASSFAVFSAHGRVAVTLVPFQAGNPQLTLLNVVRTGSKTAVVKQSDTRPTVQAMFYDAATPLTTANVASIVLNVRDRKNVLVYSITGTLLDSSTAEYEFLWPATTGVEIYQGEFQVLWSDGGVQSFPNNNWIYIKVLDDIS